MTTSRKDFVALAATAAAAVVAGNQPAAADAQIAASDVPAAHGAPVAPLATDLEAYVFFTGTEASFIEAAVERLIPTDDHGPGAKAAGVAYFIDQQLNGVFGVSGNSYRGGPWAHGTPMQGYQLRQTPAELYRQAIAACDAYCLATYHDRFAALSPAQQDTVLAGLDAATIALEGVPVKPFFEMLLQNTIEGFFADPLYGGNRGKVGWKLVGFPGVAAAYGSKIERWNEPYHVEPVSIADVQQHLPVVSANPELMEHLSMMREMKGMDR